MNQQVGSSLDGFLSEEGLLEEAQAHAIKRVIAWQLMEAMKNEGITKTKMAALLNTSRTQVNRLLDAKSDVTLNSLQRAAGLVGRKIRIELVAESSFEHQLE